eukprot:6230454-Amphidinium_carterae.2
MSTADNFVLLRAKLDALRAQRPAAALGESSHDEFQHEGADRITAIKSRTQLEMSPSLRDEREAENDECQAGLRNAARAAPLWLRDGALVGIACAIPPSGPFPTECHIYI